MAGARMHRAGPRSGKAGTASWTEPDDRRTAAAPGPQGRRPARPRRTPPLAVLPLHRPGHAHGQGGRERADTRAAGPASASAASSSGVACRTRRRPTSGCPRSSPSRSSARTPSARRPTRPTRSCSSWSSPGASALTLLGRDRAGDRGPPDRRRALAIGRSAGRTRTAAAPTSWPRRTWGSGSASSPPAALLIDYVMTVAVSTASAVAQVYSVDPGLYDFRIEIALASIALITIGNLRGLREAGLHLRQPDLPLRRARAPPDREVRPLRHRHREPAERTPPARGRPRSGPRS